MQWVTVSTLKRGILATPEPLSATDSSRADESVYQEAQMPYRGKYLLEDVPREDIYGLMLRSPDQKISNSSVLYSKQKRRA